MKDLDGDCSDLTTVSVKLVLPIPFSVSSGPITSCLTNSLLHFSYALGMQLTSLISKFARFARKRLGDNGSLCNEANLLLVWHKLGFSYSKYPWGKDKSIFHGALL